MNARFSTLIVFTLAVSCSKSVQLSIPPDKIMPVMNTIISSDSTIAVDLSWSRPILEPNQNYAAIKDATVRLFVDDAFVEELTTLETAQSYSYTSRYKPAAGERIRIDAKLKDQIIKGESEIPEKGEIVPGKAYQTPGDGFGNKAYKISFSINDRPHTDDYYQLRIFQVNNGVPDRQNPVSFIIENLRTQEGGIFDDFITPDPSGAHYFDDGPFDGQKFTIHVKSNYHKQLDRIAIELSALSKEAYRYFKSIQLQQLRNDDPLYEKVSIYSNVVNGLGIVGAANRSLVFQEIEQP